MYNGAHTRHVAAVVYRVSAEMTTAATTVRNRIGSERGATMAEYGLLLSFVALITFGILGLFGEGVTGLFIEAEEDFRNINTPSGP